MKYTTWSNEKPTEDGEYWHVYKTWDKVDDKWKFKKVSEVTIVYITIEPEYLNVDTIGCDDPNMIPFDMVSKWTDRKVEHFLMKADIPVF